MLAETNPNDFLLQPPDKQSKTHLDCKIYFFNTPVHKNISVADTATTRDVIRHIMTVYRKSTFNESKPLAFPGDPDHYQLWLIDEYESAHSPDEEMGARPAN